MLYFVSAELALGYWLFAFLSALGALQWVAVRYRLRGLAFLGSRVWGYALAVLLVVGSAAAFFISQWAAIFAPGPAGSELAVLFGSSAICALGLTLLLAPLLERWRSGSGSVGGGDGGQPVTMGHATGQLYVPPGLAPSADPANPATLQRAESTGQTTGNAGQSIGPAPAVCLLPAYGRYAVGARSMAILARRLASEGMVVLVVNADERSYAYPAILATLPAAMAVLRERPEVDPNRMGVLGEDLGADLVIRAASTSKEIKAVVALAPVLADVPPGLDLLREMSYWRALRWARDRKRATLCKELHAVEYGAKISPRPFLLLYGQEDNLVGQAPLEDWGMMTAEDTGRRSPPVLRPAFLAGGATLGPCPGARETQRGNTSPATPHRARSAVAENAGRSSGGQLQVVPDLGHMNLAGHPMVMRFVSQWLKEHL